LGPAAAPQLEVLLVFTLSFLARRGIDIRACTLFVNFWRLDPDRWFNEMANKLNVMLSHLLNFNTEVLMCPSSLVVVIQTPFEGVVSHTLLLVRISNAK
jgi:hypothetical protein